MQDYDSVFISGLKILGAMALIGVIFIAGGQFLAWYARSEYQRQVDTPCNSYAEVNLTLVPARCVSYFLASSSLDIIR